MSNLRGRLQSLAALPDQKPPNSSYLFVSFWWSVSLLVVLRGHFQLSTSGMGPCGVGDPNQSKQSMCSDPSSYLSGVLFIYS